MCLHEPSFEVEHVLVGHEFVEVVAAEHLDDFWRESDERSARRSPDSLLGRHVVQVNSVRCRGDHRLLVAQRSAQLGVSVVGLDFGLDEFGDIGDSAGHLCDHAVGVPSTTP